MFAETEMILDLYYPSLLKAGSLGAGLPQRPGGFVASR